VYGRAVRRPALSNYTDSVQHAGTTRGRRPGTRGRQHESRRTDGHVVEEDISESHGGHPSLRLCSRWKVSGVCCRCSASRPGCLRWCSSGTRRPLLHRVGPNWWPQRQWRIQTQVLEGPLVLSRTTMRLTGIQSIELLSAAVFACPWIVDGFITSNNAVVLPRSVVATVVLLHLDPKHLCPRLLAHRSGRVGSSASNGFKS